MAKTRAAAEQAAVQDAKARWAAATNRLRSLVDPAVDALAGCLASEDEKVKHTAAVSVLRAVGLWGNDLEPW